MAESTEPRRNRICIVATVPYAIKQFLRPHIAMLSREYDVTLVANGTAEEMATLLGSHVSFVPLPIARKISIGKDVRALMSLWRLFRKTHFDGVHSITPKAGLLAMVAARLAGVPRRVHTFSGQVWATRTGLRRFMLKSIDKILAMNATRLLADSHSQRLFLIESKVVKASAIGVLADGSSAGVDYDRFKYCATARQQIRVSHQIPSDAVVFMFLGRLDRDKGLMDLSRAFATAAQQRANLHLLVVGPDEDDLEREFAALAHRFPGRVHRAGFTERPEDYLSAADVVCLPSYREGFPNVPLQAASVGVPVIASRIYGVTDAVEDGVTGILHPPTSDREIAEAMLRLASSENLRRQIGAAARARVMDKFSEARVTQAFADFYRDMFTATSSSR